MTNSRQTGAYPSLVPGSQELGKGDWDVIELDDESRNAAGGIGPSTDKEGRILKVPKVILRHDWWIRYHELTHVERPSWEKSKNGLRNAIRQMLEEVALDGQCLLRDGIDLRQARDFFDWDKYKRPKDVYTAACVYFQIWSSAVISSQAKLVALYRDVCNLIIEAEKAEPKLAGLFDTLDQAAQAVFNDYSSGNCEDWADIVTAKLLGVPKEDIPNAPEPPQYGGSAGAGGGQSGAGQEADSADEEESDTGSGAGTPRGTGAGDDASDGDDDGDAGGAEGDDTEDDDGTDTCPACEGEGVDEDGDECPGCGGTGTAAPGSDEGDTEAGDDLQSAPGQGRGNGRGEGAEDGEESEGEDSFSEWDDAPIPLDKARQNDPMEFGFDPLGKHELDPHALPPETDWRERQRITNEQLQEAMDVERANRKAGETSLQAEITARTPHGALDVHRHILAKGTSMSVALAWRSCETGSTVRYPSQLYPAGRVFAKRAPGGSIILDGSGSMTWHSQHIMEAQKQMPNLYVAVYSYHAGNGYWRASKGYHAHDTYIARYCVLAQKGKLDPDGENNRKAEPEHAFDNSGADPAALWYAVRNAPKPIVWVSDGMVSFGESQEFWRQCDAIMRQHKIVRVLTIEDAIDYLLGKAVPGWHQCATVDVRWVRLGQPFQQTRISPRETMSEASRWSRLRASSKRR